MKKYSKEEFITKAKLVHGNKFDYDKVDYINSLTPVIISCKIHGDFLRRPSNFLIQKFACPFCYEEVHRNRLVERNKQPESRRVASETRKAFCNSWEEHLENLCKKLIGNTFGIIKVLRYVGERKSLYWKVECINCGNISIRHSRTINEKSGCEKCMSNVKGYAGLKSCYANYTTKARMANRHFELTLDQFKVITSGNCHYCGAEPSQVYKFNKTLWSQYTYNGVDRKNNLIGYNLENCVSCCIICNKGKLTMTYEDFCQYINRLKSLDKNRFNKRIDFCETEDDSVRLQHHYTVYRCSAKAKGHNFELSKEEFNILVSQKCHYCNAKSSKRYSGIDRKDNLLGYSWENSLPCCSICNKAKCSMSYEAFLKYLERFSNEPCNCSGR